MPKAMTALIASVEVDANNRLPQSEGQRCTLLVPRCSRCGEPAFALSYQFRSCLGCAGRDVFRPACTFTMAIYADCLEGFWLPRDEQAPILGLVGARVSPTLPHKICERILRHRPDVHRFARLMSLSPPRSIP